MRIPVIGFGAGGHCRVVIEILRLRANFEVVGLLDVRSDLLGKSVLGVPIVGSDEALPKLLADGIQHFFVGVGGTGDSTPRRRLYEAALSQEMTPVSAIHPSAVIASSATIGDGATIMAGVVINASARLGHNVIVNTGAIVEHDCVLGGHAHVATGAMLAGGVVVGEGAHIGVGAVIRQGIRIGPAALIGAGAVVVKDVLEGQTVFGNPAQPR